jgi:predicted nucleic acid-binding protein
VIVVSDTSPIIYLVLIGREEMVPQLYGKVVVPEVGRRELVHPKGPEVVREQISNSPSWMKVEAAESDAGGLRRDEEQRGEKQQGDLQDLDPGERGAILLAVRKEAGLLLIDERAGRTSARKRGLTVTGTIGVL